MGQQATKPLSALRRRSSSVDSVGTCVVVGLYKACPWPDAVARKLIDKGELAPRSFGSDTPDDDTCQEECPICFRHYPRMNISRCCRQIVCSECYLQVSSPKVDKSCPFCATAVIKVDIYQETIVSPNSETCAPLFSASDENRMPRTSIQPKALDTTAIIPSTPPPTKPLTRPIHTPTKITKHPNCTTNNINECDEEQKVEGECSTMIIQFATTAQKNEVLREAQRQARIIGFDHHVRAQENMHQSPHLSATAMADMEERLLNEAINASLDL